MSLEHESVTAPLLGNVRSKWLARAAPLLGPTRRARGCHSAAMLTPFDLPPGYHPMLGAGCSEKTGLRREFLVRVGRLAVGRHPLDGMGLARGLRHGLPPVGGRRSRQEWVGG